MQRLKFISMDPVVGSGPKCEIYKMRLHLRQSDSFLESWKKGKTVTLCHLHQAGSLIFYFSNLGSLKCKIKLIPDITPLTSVEKHFTEFVLWNVNRLSIRKQN